MFMSEELRETERMLVKLEEKQKEQAWMLFEIWNRRQKKRAALLCRSMQKIAQPSGSWSHDESRLNWKKEIYISVDKDDERFPATSLSKGSNGRGLYRLPSRHPVT